VNDVMSPTELKAQAIQSYQQGDFASAARLFEAAAKGYQSAGEDLEAAEMLNNASVAYVQAEQGEEGLRVVLPTVEFFQNRGDIRRLGMAYGNLAAAYEACQNNEAAMNAYQQSAEHLKAAGEDELSLHALKALSALQLKMGKQIAALNTMQTALEDVKHPTLKQRLLKKLLKTPWNLLGR
jgi:tetratricopeptide (TPR) repeat protein